MARYIKVNPLVAKHLNLQNDRLRVKDGNYILWQADMLAFGPLTSLPDTLVSIGAIALMPHEARHEQDGTVLRVLPEATDPRFIVPTSQSEPTYEENSTDGLEGQIASTGEVENPDTLTSNDATV